jgi:hypothetical protein
VEFEVSDADARKGQQPHELFLINLVFNHVFLLIATVSAPSLQFLTIIVPVLSVSITAYILWMTYRGSAGESSYVRCHWKLAARRSIIFFVMWGSAALLFGLVYLESGGHMTPKHYAIGGITFMPIMLTMIVLIILESEALQFARHRSLPKASAKRCLLTKMVAAELKV